MKTLRKGDRGQEVRELQQKLVAAGYPLNPVDGKFGNNTDKVVRQMQSDSGLEADGIVGKNTWAGIRKAIKSRIKALSLKTLRKGSTGQLVKVLQEQLVAHGHALHPVDTTFGTKTDSAVRHFQRTQGLLADGVVGPVTWKALGFTDEITSSVNTRNSLPTIVTGLGAAGVLASSVNRSNPNKNDFSKPVAQLTTSQKGLKFLYTREAWKNVSNRLHWPGGASGVTLGPGYDMKERSEAQITQDMIKIGVQADKAKQIAKASGLKGSEAKAFCKTNRNLVVLSNKVEFALMKMVVPYYERQVRKKIKVDLVQNEFDALVSFAYNLGSVWNSIANHINNGKISAAMTRFKAANKSGGKINDGLVKRRALEIALYTLGDYGKLREV